MGSEVKPTGLHLLPEVVWLRAVWRGGVGGRVQICQQRWQLGAASREARWRQEGNNWSAAQLV